MSEPISGNTGQVFMGGGAAVADVNNWAFTRMAEMHPYVSSSSAPYTKQVVGNYSWTATFAMMSPDGSLKPGFGEGDEIEFKGQTYTGKYVSATAKVAEIGVEGDIAGGGPVVLSVTLACHGDYSLTG